MSHFTVLVIGNDPEGQLAPYHEFECTGEDDQYVQDLDITEELRQEFREDKRRMYVDRLGELHDPSDARFYREPTAEERKKIGPIAGTGCGQGMAWTSKDWKDGKGYSTRVAFIPDGMQELWVDTDSTMSFAQFCTDWHGHEALNFGRKPDLKDKHKYGYVQLDANGAVIKVIRRTNPNAKWDWYRLGGRWTGFFKLKDGASGEVGEPGLMTERAPKGTADQVYRRDITGIERTFAVVKDGWWYESGSMGWWGCVSDRKSEKEWGKQFDALIEGLPPDTLLTLVDCHI